MSREIGYMCRVLLELLLLIFVFNEATTSALALEKQKTKSTRRDVVALVVAASKGDVGRTTDLLKKGVDVNGKAPRNGTELAGQTALMAAAEAGHLNVVRILLKNGANVNVRHEVGGTALTGAAGRGQLEAVKELLKAGADPNLMVIGRYGDVNTTLMFAMNPQNADWLKIVDALITAGAQINPREPFLSPLRLIIDENNRSILTEFLKRGANVNLRAKDGSTLLMYAAQHGSPDMVSALLDAGADVNGKNDDGETALTLAQRYSVAAWGQEVVQVLRKRGARQ